MDRSNKMGRYYIIEMDLVFIASLSVFCETFFVEIIISIC